MAAIGNAPANEQLKKEFDSDFGLDTPTKETGAATAILVISMTLTVCG